MPVASGAFRLGRTADRNGALGEAIVAWTGSDGSLRHVGIGLRQHVAKGICRSGEANDLANASPRVDQSAINVYIEVLVKRAAIE